MLIEKFIHHTHECGRIPSDYCDENVVMRLIMIYSLISLYRMI